MGEGCTGVDYWPLVYLSGPVLGLVLFRYVPIRHSFFVAISIAGLQLLIFNFLHVFCYWIWWGNALADLFVLSLVLYRIHLRASLLLELMALFLVVRVIWHICWGLGPTITDYNYAEINNGLWGSMMIVILYFGFKDALKLWIRNR